MDFKPIVTVGPSTPANGATVPARGGRGGEQIISNLHARYYELVQEGRVFGAHSIITAPVIYSTAAGTGGPLIWNGSQDKNVVLLRAGLGLTTASAVSAALGITGNSGQTSAPGTTTAITTRWNAKIGGSASAATPYNVGTVTNAGAFFMPFARLHTGAVTTDTDGSVWVDLDGLIVVPPNCWASIAASATATSAVMSATLIWAEVPI